MEVLCKNLLGKEIQEIIANSRITVFPGIYENKALNIDKKKSTLVMIVGPTGSGKSTFLESLVNNSFQKVVTATTRSKRNDEDDNAYIWIKEKQYPGETVEEYVKRIKSKYDLIEYNVFANNIYGTPKKSIDAALKKGKAVIAIENNGAREIKKQYESKVNILIFFILPDNFEQIKNRIRESRNDIEDRIQIAKKEIVDSQEITNYYIHNTEFQIYTKTNESPLDNSIKNFISFLKYILN